ncbi:MAG: signal peptidase I [Clostridia bacterium]|nr:signal peptidase I [Clostridia bacterium]
MNFLSKQENENVEKTDEIKDPVPKESDLSVKCDQIDISDRADSDREDSLPLDDPQMDDLQVDDLQAVGEETIDREGEEGLVEQEQPHKDPSEEDVEEDAPAQTPPTKDDRPAEKDGGLKFVYDTIELVAISLVLVMLILTVFARHSPVTGSSMYPTILGRNEGSLSENAGQDVLLISNLFYTPKKGDIVVVQTPNIKPTVESALGHPIVKRIIATEHDRVEIDFVNWRIVINGQVYEEGFGSAPYVFYDNATLVNGVPSKQMNGFHAGVITALQQDPRCNYSHEGTVYAFTVPEGQVFILGDNRNNSSDSRAIGFIDERWIIGKSLLRVYPFDRFGIVE